MEPKIKGTIDLTDGIGEQHISDRPGKTEGGTTEDDYHGEATVPWPSALDRDEFSPSEQACIEVLASRPELTYSKVAEEVGCTDTVLYNARKKIQGMGLEDEVRFDVVRKNQHKTEGTETKDTPKTTPEEGEAKDWFIEKMSDDPSITRSEIEDEMPGGKGWNLQNYYNVMRPGKGKEELKRRIIKKGNWSEATGYIRDKLEGVEVDVEKPQAGSSGEKDRVEDETPVEEKQTEPETSERVSELEETVAELVKLLCLESDGAASEVMSEMFGELPTSEIATAANSVVNG